LKGIFVITCVKETRYVDGYRIRVTFNTGETAVVDFSQMIANNPSAASLRDVHQFKSFYLDEWPTLAWHCGFDIAPESLYQMATGKLPAWMRESYEKESNMQMVNDGISAC
jgi:hypothetical protein